MDKRGNAIRQLNTEPQTNIQQQHGVTRSVQNILIVCNWSLQMKSSSTDEILYIIVRETHKKQTQMIDV